MKTHLLPSAIFLIFFSCDQQQKQTQPGASVPKVVTTITQGSTPKRDSLKPPQIVLLDTCPKPEAIHVPEKTYGRYTPQIGKGLRKRELKPPVIKPLPIVRRGINGELLPDQSPAGMGFFTTYNVAQGLANNDVNSIVEDKLGNLWFATWGGGVSRYDGKSFTNFTADQGLANNDVNSMAEDKSGNLWFACLGGVSRYDGRSFTNFTTAHGLVKNTVNFIEEDKSGNLWFVADGGVSRYDGRSFTNFTTAQGLANNNVYSMAEDKSGNLWFGTIGGVSKYNGSSFTNFTTAQGLANNLVYSIAEDKSGNLWFGNRNGVSRYDGKSFTNFTTAQGLANNLVYCIAEDKLGNLWFGTWGGVSRYDGKSFTNFTTAHGLAKNSINSITEDKSGNLWFATDGGGVSRYDGKSFTNFTTSHGLIKNSINSIAEDKSGNLWFAADDGVSRYDGRSFTNFTTAQGLVDNAVLSIAKDKSGNLWFGTYEGGVSRYDGKSFTNFTTAQGLPNNEVYHMAKDTLGNIWFGTRGGVSRYDGKSFTNFTTAQGLANNFVSSIAEDKSGNLWFGTSGGVSRYDGKYFTNFTTAQGLASNEVYSITKDKSGNLWFGTRGGLSMLGLNGQENIAKKTEKLNENEDKHLFTTYTTADGLPDNFVTQVLVVEDGRIYVGSTLGICELIPSPQPGRKAKLGFIFNSSTGYPVKDVNAGQNNLFKDSRGIIWIATGSDKTALVRFDPSEVHRNPKPSTVLIQSILINKEVINWYQLQKNENDSLALAQQEVMTYGRLLLPGERDSIHEKYADIQFDSISKFYPLPQNLVLPYQKNNIGFEFAAIEPAIGDQVKYQYLLDGYDKEWSSLSNKTNANFGNISEGNYTFRLKALNPFGIWSETSYQFRVLPPWYRSWWAYTIYVLLFLGALRIFSKWRERNLRSEKEKLERRVEERTNELNDTIENLKSTQSQLIQAEKMASLGELTAGIAHEIKNPLNFVNNFSELNTELIGEMKQEIEKGNTEEVKAIASDIEENEKKIIYHGGRADAIVKGMLQHSRTSTGQKEPTDINALADEYLRLSYHGTRAKDKSFNATMQTDFDETIGKINIVPQNIGRVFLNLFNNAIYSVNEKKIKLGDTYEPSISVSTKKINNQLQIKVKDNGCGIPEKILDKIFQPFFTTKPAGQGTGLGLSMAYDIITKELGGHIKVITKEGEGAEFVIELPMLKI